MWEIQVGPYITLRRHAHAHAQSVWDRIKSIKSQFSPGSHRLPVQFNTTSWNKPWKQTECSLSPEAGGICFLTEALQADGWKRLVYLKRHHADLTRDSCFLPAHSFIRDDAERHSPVLPHCVWVLAASVRGHNNSQRASCWRAHPSLQSLLHGGSAAGRWRALPRAHSHLAGGFNI